MLARAHDSVRELTQKSQHKSIKPVPYSISDSKHHGLPSTET